MSAAETIAELRRVHEAQESEAWAVHRDSQSRFAIVETTPDENDESVEIFAAYPRYADAIAAWHNAAPRVLAVLEAAERLYATEREVDATNDAEPFDEDAWEVAHQAYQDSYSDLRAAVAALDDRR